ncbi:3-deoxy-7-phosphoheptulonate synthase [Ramicandelaber brevisporus]|nr:3-deoxy-7-phosphoheptulonate synthase [Ramicandelaber brevisporus]
MADQAASPAAAPAADYADDARIIGQDPLIPPHILTELELPITEQAKSTIARARKVCADIVHGRDDRLMVVVGPCSIHNIDAALEYANLLKPAADRLQDDLCIVMRAYFEKPRSTKGWRGLINDPDLDGTYQINKGLRMARKLYLDINNMGLPVACELLDTISPQWLADLVSWGAIGARTTESQNHRELASGVSMPVGFKNGTNGDITIAVQAMIAASSSHVFLGVTKAGISAITKTSGNPDTFVILRGGSKAPNYDAESVSSTVAQLEKAKVTPRVVIDCSHGNSNKDHRNQPKVNADVAAQVANGSAGIIGVMIESNLVEGRQDVPPTGPQELIYGKSITDACIDWATTEKMLDELASAVRARRLANKA